MSFQKLNGWRLSVSGSKSASRQEKVVGPMGKRFTGAASKNQRVFEGEITEELCFTDPLCADTLEDLFSGEGFFFPFIVDVWSENSGIGPELSSDWVLNPSDGPVATRGHSVTVGASGLIYDAGLIDFTTAPDGGRWTLIYYVFESGSWVHKVARNDETGFVDGVYSSSLAPSEFVVSQGAVAFASGTKLAALAIISTWVCDDAAVAFYEWGNADHLGAYWRLDQSFADELGRFDGIPSAGPTNGAGQVKSGIAFTGGSRIEIDPTGLAGADATLSLFEAGQVAIECWVNPSSAGEASSGVIYSKGLGAGFVLSVAPATTPGKLAIVFTAQHAVTNGSWTIDDAVVIGEFSYIALNYNGVDATIYINSSEPSAWSSIVASSGALLDDSGDGPIIGNIQGLGRGFDGNINEVRQSVQVLPERIIKERLVAGRNRRSIVGPQMMGSLPEVLVSGESVGWNLLSMFPEVKSEDYVAVTVNSQRVKARALKVSLMTTTSVKASGIPASDKLISFSSRRRSSLTGGSIKDLYGLAWSLNNFSESQMGKKGPFNFTDRSFSLDGTNDLTSQGAAESFYGRSQITFLSWVKRGSTFTQNLFLFSDSLGTRAGMHIGNTNEVVMRYRPTSADVTASTTAAPTIDAEWHLVGGIIDLKANTAELIIDGVVVSSEAIVFAADEFSDESDPNDFIGVNEAAANRWTGSIATVGVWLRRLSLGEILTVYEKAKKGFFH